MPKVVKRSRWDYVLPLGLIFISFSKLNGGAQFELTDMFVMAIITLSFALLIYYLFLPLAKLDTQKIRIYGVFFAIYSIELENIERIISKGNGTYPQAFLFLLTQGKCTEFNPNPGIFSNNGFFLRDLIENNTDLKITHFRQFK